MKTFHSAYIGAILLEIITFSLTHSVRQQVIVDVDIGVDDYEALVILLNADRREEIEIKAIILTQGNTEMIHLIDNLYRLLDIIGRRNIKVYAGTTNMTPEQEEHIYYYGQDGFADLNLSKPLNPNLQTESASAGIAKIVSQHPNEIIYITLGPLTNLAIFMEDEQTAAQDFKHIYCLGGNYGTNNPEYNFAHDPEAVDVVLKHSDSKMVVIFPFEVCVNNDVTMGWRWSINISNPVWELSDRAEKKLFSSTQPEDLFISCDPVLATIFLEPNHITGKESSYGSMTLEGPNRGVIIYENGERQNLQIITGFRPSAFKHTFVEEFEIICDLYYCNESSTL